MAKKIENFYWEEILQVRHRSILLYNLPTKQLSYQRNILNYKTYSGTATNHAAKRIRKAVDLLCQLSPPVCIYNPVTQRHIMHTLSFVTLTISSKEQHLTAAEGYKLALAPWLLRMRRKAKLNTYIWKAEFQKNGQLHYHVTTPSFIHYSLIRDEWNNVLRKAGLLSQWKGKDGKQPNSTDVHAVYKVKNIQAYLSKYLAKGNKDVLSFWNNYDLKLCNSIESKVQPRSEKLTRKISSLIKKAKELPLYKVTKGKIWDCSLNLKRHKHFSCQSPRDFEVFQKDARILPCDHCTMIFYDDPTSLLPRSVITKYNEYLNQVRNYTRETAKAC